MGAGSAGRAVSRDHPPAGVHLGQRHCVTGMRRRAKKVGVAGTHLVGIGEPERKGNKLRDYFGTLNPRSPELAGFVLISAPRAPVLI